MNIFFKRVSFILIAWYYAIILSAQTPISFERLFETGDMTPYIGQTLQLTDTLHLNGWGSQPRYMWVSDHRVQNSCEQGDSPRKAYSFSLTDNSMSDYKRLGTKLADITMKVTTAEYATLIGTATYVNDTRPTQHNCIGDYSLKVCGFNVEKFFIDIPGYETKTTKVIEALRCIDADIFGLCEVGEYPSAMNSIANALNRALGADVYAAIADNIADSSTVYSRSGFIYKKAKVSPYGEITEASTSSIYKKRNIIQGFIENATGERFVLSMNHFKAKDTTADQSEGTRITNATHLLNTLSSAVPYKYEDDDILIIGDLNSCTGEIPMKMLYEEGYNCLMSVYEPDGYSIVYNRTIERLDHALASATMAAQVTGATTFHINTDERSDNTELNMYRSSDHDPVIIGLRLQSDNSGNNDEGKGINLTTTFKEGLNPFVQQSVAGYQTWFSDANYGARISGYSGGNNNENIDWLVSPSLNLEDHTSAQLTFSHTINYDSHGKMKEYQSLWISDDYNGDVQTANWEPLIIPAYPNGMNWNFISSGSIDIPQRYLKKNVHIAFKYISTPHESNATWQITDFSLIGKYTSTSLPTLNASQSNLVYIVDREIIVHTSISHNTSTAILYDISGGEIQRSQLIDTARFRVPTAGIYLLKIGSEVHKIAIR